MTPVHLGHCRVRAQASLVQKPAPCTPLRAIHTMHTLDDLELILFISFVREGLDQRT